MIILRKQVLMTNDIQVGDQLSIRLDGFGDFSATAHKITDEGVLFIFDDCVAERPMNGEWTNKGGYEASDLCRWLNEELLPTFPEDIRPRVCNLTIPTYGQMFGHDDFYNDAMEPDDDEQLPLMKKRKNRVADFNDDYEWYWLQNATKEDYSAAHFAYVSSHGHTDYYDASNASGVRPAFLLVSDI